MDKSSASAYVYAKACAMYAKSFIGKKTNKLFEAKNIKDLWTLVLKEEVPIVPEGKLADILEHKVTEKLLSDMLKLINAYDKPDPIIKAIISKYDYTNLKIAYYESEKKTDSSSFLIDLGKYSVFNWNKWPNLTEVVHDSIMEQFLLPSQKASIDEIRIWDSQMDRIYYHSIWNGFKALSSNDKKSCEKLILTDIILQNIVWILRLRTYYSYTKNDIIPLLAGSQCEETEKIFCRPAYFAIEQPLDDWKAWKNWEYSWILNAYEDSIPWIIDPRHVQLACDKYIFNLAVKQFHSSAFTIGILIAFFKIKQLEEYTIRAAIESLRVGTDDEFKKEFIWG